MSFKKSLSILVVIAGVVYFLFSSFFADVQINKYEDIEVVKKQKAIQNGWIPAILPKSSYEITETHDIDANTLFGSFKYKEEDEESFMQNLMGMDDDKKTLFWENFLFRVDKTKNIVKFRNRTLTQ